MRRDLPTGEVTFLFTDIESSTKLLHELGPGSYADALDEHRRLLRVAFTRHGGVEVDTQGDAFFYAFPSAAGAIAAAGEGREALRSGRIRVRIGIHTGAPHRTAEGYVGEDVHKGARIAAAGHGGQVLLSRETKERVDADVRDLGEHRVKDFADPVWIFQLGSERFPPLKTISNTNLPRPPSSFIGRANELEHVVERLKAGARLMTLTGPGGSGKTRLAIEAAAELVPEHRNGVFWVGLAAVRDPGMVLDTIAQTLGAKDGLTDHIAEKEMLLLLDNFEQVLEAAPEISALLSVCPALRVLVTSRELLRVEGEVEYAVPPLTQNEAVELFCTRSGLEVDATIAELCRRLDDLPLALELAAARTRVLSPTHILQRLSGRLDLFKGGRDADPRQATLRATIAWSHDLLSPEDQRLFARFAVFAGGGTLSSVEDVTGADLDTLQSLVDKSLVRHTGDRFWMLETIREFAVEQFDASGERDHLRRRHADHFLALAEAAEPHLLRESVEWLDRLEQELDNIRASLDHLTASGDHQGALRLLSLTWVVWFVRSSLAEGMRRLESVLAIADEPSPARARALVGAADIAMDLGDHAATVRYGEEALKLCRTFGDTWGEAYTLLTLGFPFAERDDWPEAKERFAASARMFTEIGDAYNALGAARRLAWAYEELGDLKRARALREENLRQARAIGDEHTEAQSLAWLAEYEIEEGRIVEAAAMLEEAHRIHRRRPGIHERYWDAILLPRFAAPLAQHGIGATAASLLACCEALFEEIEGRYEPWLEKKNERTLAKIRSELDRTSFEEAWERGRTLSIDAAVALGVEELRSAARSVEDTGSA